VAAAPPEEEDGKEEEEEEDARREWRRGRWLRVVVRRKEDVRDVDMVTTLRNR
jgi:hypothetical protein